MTMDQQAAMERLQDLYREKNEYLEEFLEWITPYEFTGRSFRLAVLSGGAILRMRRVTELL